MRKLRIALLALFAMVFSLALFACGSKDQIDTIEVNGTASIALTDADTETTARAKLDELEFYCTYLGNTEDHTFAASEYTVDWTGVTFGKTGNYTAKVTTSKNNDAKAYAEVAVSITHAFGNPDADGVQVCTFCNAVAQTKTINDTFSIGAWAKGVTVGKDNEYVLTDNRIGNNTAFVARLDKGMSITLKGTGKATSNDNPWYFPILGVANIEEDWSIIDRQDGWSIYGAMNGVLAQLSGKPFSDSDPETGWPGAEAATMYRVYVDGKGSATADYYDKGDVPIELTWEYGTDNSFLMQWNNPTGNGIRTARVLLSDRQFYNALLHGEFFDATFTEVQIIQTRKLESVDSITVNTVEKVLENKYLNNNCFNIGITYAGNLKDTAVNDGMVTVYGNTEKVTKLPDDNTAQGGMAYNGKGNAWEDLSTTKMTKNFQSYKVRVQTGLDWFEQLLPEADVAKINAAIIPNAVDHGNPNEITVDNVVFRATDLSKVEFTQNGEKAGVAIEGAAATLSTDQAGKLTMGSGSGKHYVAFTLYANGATTFAGTATIEGTKGYAKASEDGKKLDVVLAVTADLKEATIKGVNGGTDIVVSFGEMLGCSTSSTLSFNTLKINETKDLTVEYDISGLTGVTDAASVASKLSLAINNMLVPFNTTGGTLNTGSFTAISGFAIKSAAYASGKLTLVYTIPAMDASKPVSYTFNLVNNESGAVLASDKLYYDLTFAENDNALVGDYYVSASGNYVYLLRPYTGSDIESAAVKDTLFVTLNAGAATGSEYEDENFKLYKYLRNHDLSYAVNEDGSVSFTDKGLLADFATGTLTAFGTLNNGEDTDYGAVLVVRLDARKVGVNPRKQDYAIAVNAEENEPFYNTVTKDGVVGAKTTYELPETTVTLTEGGNCINSADVAYAVKGTGDAVVFYAFADYTYAEHVWVKGENNLYTCSTCGSVRNYEAKAETYVDANALNVGSFANLVETGLTVTFELQGTANSDWGAAALVTAEGNMIVTLPNLDPWNNSVNADIMNADNPETEGVDESKTVLYAKVADATEREQELATKLAGTNLFPTANNTSYLKNGGAYNSFLSGYWFVTIVVSKTGGVQYYQNGTVLVDYPANAAMGGSNVGEFAELFLSLARKGLVIGRSGVTVKNAMVIKKAVDATQANDLFKAYVQEVGMPTMPGPEKLPEMPEIEETWSESVTVGVDGTVEGTAWQGYSVGKTWYIKAGQKIVVSGVLKADKRFTNADGNLDGNWHGIGVIFDRGLLQDGVTPLNGRMDNFINGTPANNFWNVEMVPAAVDANGAPIGDWVAEMAALREGPNTAEYTFDFTDPTKLVCTIKVTGAAENEGHAGNVFTQSYTITAMPNIKYRDGDDFKLEDWALVGLAVDSGYLTGTATCTYTAPEAKA